MNIKIDIFSNEELGMRNEELKKTIPNSSFLIPNSIKILSYFLQQKEITDSYCLKGFDFKSVSFDILFTDDAEIEKINTQYRSKTGATDVITFALFADSEPKFLHDGDAALGEIIISLDTIERQAKENGETFENELYYIIAHGILHLLGFDHRTQEDYEFMVDWQNKALKEINVKIC